MTIPEIRVSVVRDGGQKTEGRPALDCPARVAEMARGIVAGDEREHMIIFLLDSRSRVRSYSVISIGTLQASLVHPREVFRPAIVAGAAAVILCHNHPSGQVDPSPDDRDTTRRLVKAGELIGIHVLDHVIIGNDETASFSFRERGLLS